jgi:hypothetical protein
MVVAQMNGVSQVFTQRISPEERPEVHERSVRQSPQLPVEMFLVFSPQLISHNMTVSASKCVAQMKRVRIPTRCERGNDELDCPARSAVAG